MNYLRAIRLKKQPPKNSYLNNLPLVKSLKNAGELTFDKPVTFLVGENGSGKSTLLEAVAVAMGFNPEGGSRDFNFSTSDTHSPLYTMLTCVKSVRLMSDGFFLRAESFYNAASYIDDTAASNGYIRYGGKSFHRQSHGESFLALAENRFGPGGLYILDEPEAALSPTRLMSLMVIIHRLARQHSQFIIATHSPILMTLPDSRIIQLTDDGFENVSYRETEHFIITKEFVNNPQKMLDMLFK